MTEAQIHRQIADFFRVALGGSAFAFHPPMGGKRPKGEAGKLKGMLAVAGLPDFGVIDSGKIMWIEVKAPKGRVSPAQALCHQALRRAGAPVYVIRSLDEAIAALRQAGVPLRVAEAV